MKNNKRCWKKYNKSLIQRGSITFWIDEELLKNDQAFESTKGRPVFKTPLIQAGFGCWSLFINLPFDLYKVT